MNIAHTVALYGLLIPRVGEGRGFFLCTGTFPLLEEVGEGCLMRHMRVQSVLYGPLHWLLECTFIVVLIPRTSSSSSREGGVANRLRNG